jgi:hypothetical protein
MCKSSSAVRRPLGDNGHTCLVVDRCNPRQLGKPPDSLGLKPARAGLYSRSGTVFRLCGGRLNIVRIVISCSMRRLGRRRGKAVTAIGAIRGRKWRQLDCAEICKPAGPRLMPVTVYRRQISGIMPGAISVTCCHVSPTARPWATRACRCALVGNRGSGGRCLVRRLRRFFSAYRCHRARESA